MRVLLWVSGFGGVIGGCVVCDGWWVIEMGVWLENVWEVVDDVVEVEIWGW